MNSLQQLHDFSLPLGVYVAIRLHKEDRLSILNFCQQDLKINMSNSVSPYESRMHTTILFSQDAHGAEHQTFKQFLQNKEFIAYPLAWEIFFSQNTGKRCLVLKLTCPEIEKYHQEFKEKTGLEHFFKEYVPHISIHYDYQEDLPQTLPHGSIRLKEMYIKPLYYKKPIITQNEESILKKLDDVTNMAQNQTLEKFQLISGNLNQFMK